MTIQDDLPNEPITSDVVEELENEEGVTECHPLFGLPPAGRSNIVIFGMGTTDGMKLVGFNGSSWEMMEGIDEDAKDAQEMLNESIDTVASFIIENYEVQPELVISERPAKDDVLDAFPDSPLERDEVELLGDDPAFENQEALFEHTESGEIICVGLVRVPVREEEVPLHFILGFHPQIEQWKIISEHEVIDHETTMNESDGAVMMDWLTNRYDREAIELVEPGSEHPPEKSSN